MIRKLDEFVDYSEIIILIEKLRLYLELEDQIMSSIKKSLNVISGCYDSDNKLVLNKINNNICNSLDIMYDNKEKYINYLTNIVKIFSIKDNANSLSYEKYDIS